MPTPYSDLPSSRFWRSGVAEVHPTALSGLYVKKFEISPSDMIATAGSCFAQQVSRHLKRQGFNLLDAEPAPFDLAGEAARRLGFGVYSARYGNLYTARQLLQLMRDAETGAVREEDVWETDGRFFDALRPSVEPGGLESPDEVLAHRREHLGMVAELFESLDVLIFTLGLTEAWIDRRTGTVYPTCPGAVAGKYDPAIHAFANFGFPEVFADMLEVERRLAAFNPKVRILLTVSPVPLTATASGDHVLAATAYSKATLRAVCGSLKAERSAIDYFPSYEIVTSPSSRGLFYEPNLRSVTELGVETVMKAFFAEHPGAGAENSGRAPTSLEDAGQQAAGGAGAQGSADDPVCDEVLLDAFGRR